MSGNRCVNQGGGSVHSLASTYRIHPDYRTISFHYLRVAVGGLLRHAYIGAETVEYAPSESTNCVSILPHSCFVGGPVNLTPFSVIS